MDSEKRRMVERELQKLQERRLFNLRLMERSLGNTPASIKMHDSETGYFSAMRECDIRLLSELFHISCEEIMGIVEEERI